MIAEFFLDTNILVYSVDSDPENVRKREISLDLMESLDFGVSAQVLQEFFVTVTRKLETPLEPGKAAVFVEKLSRLPVVVTDADLVMEGVLGSIRNRISYWDSAILVAAGRLGSRVVYSEDLNHGQVFGSVRVVNPYL
ncbi:MAG: PIN domain-containing protein [Opitutaceae bacterium]